ncbi:type II toxin-antitoxin system prevent-host-death family antitoxin [Patulibacter sp. NPDC049589]|uniref:type II toxin-antitoxin system Phd/YefM family antitoxin n=1 Tax=Patulibacter sp. NPDC049589 TaxID=3154731 RepID=UPI00341A552E
MEHTVSIRELRNQGGDVVDRVARGEGVTITRSGRAVATLRPVATAPLTAEALLARWHGLPTGDAAALRRDLDAVLDPSL